MSSPTCPPSGVERRVYTVYPATARADEAERRIAELEEQLAAARAESERLYCESWAAAVKVAEIREVVEEVGFAQDVLNHTRSLLTTKSRRVTELEALVATLEARLAVPPSAPSEAFTSAHALEPDMPGLPGQETGGAR